MSSSIMQSRDDVSTSSPASNNHDQHEARAEANNNNNNNQDPTTATNTTPFLTRLVECFCDFVDGEYWSRFSVLRCVCYPFCILLYVVLSYVFFCITRVIYAVIDSCTSRILCPGQYWFSRVKRHGLKYQYVPEEFFKNDRRFVMAAVQQDGEALGWASPEFQNDKGIVMAAVHQSGLAIQYASPELQNDKDIKDIECQIWILRLEYFVPLSKRTSKHGSPFNDSKLGNPFDLQYAPLNIRNDKEIVMVAVQEKGMTLAYASPDLRNDKQVVIAAIQSSGGFALQFASPDLQNDKQVIMEAISLDGNSLCFASTDLRKNKEVVMAAIEKSRGGALQFTTVEMQNDKDVVLYAIQNNTYGDGVFQYASPELRNDKGVFMAAFQNDPDAFHHASSQLQKDKDIALQYVRLNPDNIKYLDKDLKREPDVLIAAGLFDKNHDHQKKSGYKKIALSTRFALDASCDSEATNFTKLLKQQPYIQYGGFKIYSPNAFDKKSCDPDWTNIDHPCRGTNDTCQYNNILTESGHPTDDCCWRYSFRFQLQEAKDTGGFMIQVVETAGGSFQELGRGQKIEREIAQQLKLKIFRVYRPRISFYKDEYRSSDNTESRFQCRHINKVVRDIRQWYDSGQQDMSECITLIHEYKTR